MKFSACLALTLSVQTLSAATFGLLDLNATEGEIRFAAVVRGGANFQMEICPVPRATFTSGCSQGSPSLLKETSLAEAVASIENFLSLHSNSTAVGPQKEGTDLSWLREVAIEKIEKGGLADSAIAKLQAQIDQFAAATDPKTEAKIYERRIKLATRITDKLRASPIDSTQENLFREVDGEAYRSLIAPVAGWIETSLCQCRPARRDKPTPQLICKLSLGNNTLAEADATLGDCRSRLSCSQLSWRRPGSPNPIDFSSLLAEECSGYFTPGSPALVPEEERLINQE